MLATVRNNADVIRTFLRLGANKYAANHQGLRAYDVATQYRRGQEIEILLR